MTRIAVTTLVLSVFFVAGRLSIQLPASAEGRGGQAACTAQNGDVDGDATVGIGDVIRLLICQFTPERCPGGLIPICADPRVAQLEAELEVTNSELAACTEELANTSVELANCNVVLDAAQSALAIAETDLAACQADLAERDTQLEACQADMMTCTEELSSTSVELMACEQALASCNTKAGVPASEQTLCYDESGREIASDEPGFPGQDSNYQAGCPTEARFVMSDVG